MLKYYFNPKTHDLICYDTEEREIFVLEAIGNIRFQNGHEIDAGAKVEHGPGGTLRKRHRTTPEEIEKVKELDKEGMSKAEIAREVGIHYNVVLKILNK